jgi:phage/plasmid-like protein (TIGR03299 family)
MTTTIERHAAWASVGSWIATPEKDGLRAADIITQAGLDWTVSKEALTATVLGTDGVTTLDVPKVGIVRTSAAGTPLDVIGVTGPDYVPVQNHEMIALLDGIVDGAGASFEAAGAYRNNGTVFVAMRLPEGFTVGDDQSDVFVFAENSHDGSGAFHVSVTGLRLRCTNQIKSIRRNNAYTISFRHTKNLKVTGERVRTALNLAVRATTELSAEAAELAAIPMDLADFRAFTEVLVPISEEATERITLSRLDTRDNLVSLFAGPTNANIGGTRWAALNAVSEYDQWVRPVRGADRGLRQMESRLKGDSLTEKAGRLLLPA